MVEDVGEDHLELGSKAFRDLKVLLKTHVHVPVRHAAVKAKSTVAGIVAQDRLADVVPCGSRVREYIAPAQAAGADSIAANEVTRTLSAVERRERNRVLRDPVTEEVRRVAFAKRLPATVD